MSKRVQSGDRLEDQQKQGGCAGRRVPLFLFLGSLAHLIFRIASCFPRSTDQSDQKRAQSRSSRGTTTAETRIERVCGASKRASKSMKPRRAEFTGWASLSISIIEHSAERREETDSRIRAERGAVQSGDRLEDQQKQGGCAGRRVPLFLFLGSLAHLIFRIASCFPRSTDQSDQKRAQSRSSRGTTTAETRIERVCGAML